MTTLAPSRAARKAMALPIPRLAPVMKRVLPLSVAAGLKIASFISSGTAWRILVSSSPLRQQVSKRVDKNTRLFEEQMMMHSWQSDNGRLFVQYTRHVPDNVRRKKSAP